MYHFKSGFALAAAGADSFFRTRLENRFFEKNTYKSGNKTCNISFGNGDKNICLQNRANISPFSLADAS